MYAVCVQSAGRFLSPNHHQAIILCHWTLKYNNYIRLCKTNMPSNGYFERFSCKSKRRIIFHEKYNNLICPIYLDTYHGWITFILSEQYKLRIMWSLAEWWSIIVQKQIIFHYYHLNYPQGLQDSLRANNLYWSIDGWRLNNYFTRIEKKTQAIVRMWYNNSSLRVNASREEPYELRQKRKLTGRPHFKATSYSSRPTSYLAV